MIVSWSNSSAYDVLEFRQSIDKVIETINNYHCRNLLIDASEAIISLEDEALAAALSDFATKIGQTGIKKVARIITSSQIREEKVQAIRDEIVLPFEIYDISSREQALHWLKEG